MPMRPSPRWSAWRFSAWQVIRRQAPPASPSACSPAQGDLGQPQIASQRHRALSSAAASRLHERTSPGRARSRRPPTRAAMSAAGGNELSPASIVFVTVPDKEVGKEIATALVTQKLAACVNIIPGIESVYSWDGKIQSDDEALLKIKTRSSLVPALSEAVKALHPYELCEVTAVRVEGGSEAYLDWVRTSCS